MIVCKSKDDYNILKSLRAHGWDREIKKKLKILILLMKVLTCDRWKSRLQLE